MQDGYYHGINKLKKPATKVMAPPGGSTHFNIFSAPQPEEQKPINECQAARSKSSVFAGPVENNPSRAESDASKPTSDSTSEGGDKGGQHTATKVLAPPGGKSNISIFGENSANANPPEVRRQEKHHTPGPSSHNIFGGGNDEVIGQRAKNRKPPGGESHNIFG